MQLSSATVSADFAQSKWTVSSSHRDQLILKPGCRRWRVDRGTGPRSDHGACMSQITLGPNVAAHAVPV